MAALEAEKYLAEKEDAEGELENGVKSNSQL